MDEEKWRDKPPTVQQFLDWCVLKTCERVAIEDKCGQLDQKTDYWDGKCVSGKHEGVDESSLLWVVVLRWASFCPFRGGWVLWVDEWWDGTRNCLQWFLKSPFWGRIWRLVIALRFPSKRQLWVFELLEYRLSNFHWHSTSIQNKKGERIKEEICWPLEGNEQSWFEYLENHFEGPKKVLLGSS